MENIREAVERARTHQRIGAAPRAAALQPHPGSAYDSEPKVKEVELNSVYLQSNRIISHIATDPRAKSFDMLRTQILQSMDLKEWKILAVTSPTPACGKTVTAVNLALSVARQPERSVLLVDLDFQKPKVASLLGLEFDDGALGVVEGRTTLSKAIIHARVDNRQLMVLPTASTIDSSEVVGSRAMATMLDDLRRDYHSQTIIIDLPPILTSDDVIALLPQVDCILLVAAVGTSTASQVEECSRHLRSTEVVRVALNKVPEASSNYYYY